MVERHAVEDERFTAGALYNLASSSIGVGCILDAGDNAVLGEPPSPLMMQARYAQPAAAAVPLVQPPPCGSSGAPDWPGCSLGDALCALREGSLERRAGQVGQQQRPDPAAVWRRGAVAGGDLLPARLRGGGGGGLPPRPGGRLQQRRRPGAVLCGRRYRCGRSSLPRPAAGTPLLSRWSGTIRHDISGLSNRSQLN